VPVFLPKAPAPKSKTAALIAQNHYSSPQIISAKSPAISATRYNIIAHGLVELANNRNGSLRAVGV
jgi:hypothetical protein